MSSIQDSTAAGAVLTKLQRVRQVPGGWIASCPAPTHGKGNGDRNPSLSISEGSDGRVLLHCHSGCNTEAILDAMGMRKADLFSGTERHGPSSSRKPFEQSNRGTNSPESQGNPVRTGLRTGFEYDSNTGDFTPALTLQQLAEAKQLPVDFLKSMGCSDTRYQEGHAVRMAYRNPDGSDGAVRYRVALEKPPQGGDRFRWKTGSKVQLLGLDRLDAARDADEITMVEGETDYFTLAYNDIPAVGVAGANNYRDGRDAEHLDGIEAVYVVVEPDAGGEAFRKRLSESSLRDRVRFIDLTPFGAKDVSALWCDDPNLFADRFERAKVNATPVPDIMPAVGDVAKPQPLLPAPAFPEDVFPAAIDHYLRAGARSIGVPIEMIAVPLLSLAGATAGNAVEVVLKRGFTQLPTLWTGIIAPPGTAKSPAFQVAQWPVHRLQHDAIELWQRQRADHDADMSRWKATPKEERGDTPVPPSLHHIYSTDATIEALVGALQTCPGVSIIRDELSGFVSSFDQYRGGKGSDRQEYLQLWAGAPIKSDRKGGGTVYAQHPVAGICGGIQPDILRSLHDPHGKRDGLVERFLLCVPDVQPLGWTEDDLDPALLVPVTDVFRKLRSIRVRMAEHLDDTERVSVNLSPDARRAWIDWFNGNAQATEHANGLRRGFYAKLPSQVARIALVLHCLHNPDDPRTMLVESTMVAAIDVAEFFRQHLDRVLPLIGDHSRGEPVGLPGRILRILRNPDVQDPERWVRRTALLRGLGNVTAHVLTEGLTQLYEQGRVETCAVHTDTKPAEAWRECEVPGVKYSNNSRFPSPNGVHSSNSSNTTNGSVSLFEQGGPA